MKILEGKGLVMLALLGVLFLAFITISVTSNLTEKSDKLGPSDVVKELERQNGIAD